ncbi:MAG: glycosyltransferase family 39 protein [Methanoregulaceae archaeon]|nr:glycosyltransferase family 39 protein [Methanoregulaceae archaeon]
MGHRRDRNESGGRPEICEGISSPVSPILNKIRWPYVLLALIILIGLFGTSFLPPPVNAPGRVYHMDSPSIGYHNMKENEYLSQARYQWTEDDYLRRRTHLAGLDPGPGYFEEYPQMPLLPWMIMGAWAVFGVQIWAARLIIVLFSVATIPALYLLVKRLSKDNEYLALTAAFIFSLLPVAVFFGRNIQPEAPALFFLVLGLWLYVRWTDDSGTKNLIFSGLALMMCAMFKPTFLIGMISMPFIFPFERLFQKFRKDGIGRQEFVSERTHTIIQWVLFAACFLPYFLWNWVTSAFLNTKEALFAGTSSRIDLFRVFTGTYWSEYWTTISEYLRDNFALWFLVLALIGFVFMLVQYRTRLSKFCIGYAIAIIPYGMILADYISQHSYYQMPFVPLVCICAAYCIFTTGMFIKKVTKVRHIQYVPLIILLFILPSAVTFTNVHYDATAFGIDVGASYIQSHTGPSERLFVEGGPQTFGVCYNSDRRCAGISDVSTLEKAEEELNFTTGFIHVTGGGLYSLNLKPGLVDHIQDNYRITQVGLLLQKSTPELQYIIVQKGGTSNLKNLTSNEIAQTQPVLAKKYETTYGSIPFFTMSEST